MSEPSRVKPIVVLWQEGVGREHLQGVFDGIYQTLAIAGLETRDEVRTVDDLAGIDTRRYVAVEAYGSCWDDRSLTGDIAWYFSHARTGSAYELSYVSGSGLLEALREKSFFKKEEWYQILVTRDAMYQVDGEDHDSIWGLGQSGIGAVISVHPFLRQASALQRKKITLLTMHECGHMFGLIPRRRRTAVKQSKKYGRHCAKATCIMNQSYSEATFLGDARRFSDPFCKLCRKGMCSFLGI